MNEKCKKCNRKRNNICKGKDESFDFCFYSCDPLEHTTSIQSNELSDLIENVKKELDLFKLDTLKVQKYLIGVDLLVGECVYGYKAPVGYIVY